MSQVEAIPKSKLPTLAKIYKGEAFKEKGTWTGRRTTSIRSEQVPKCLYTIYQENGWGLEVESDL